MGDQTDEPFRSDPARVHRRGGHRWVALLMAINVIAFVPVAAVWLALLAFAVLAAGNLLKGI